MQTELCEKIKKLRELGRTYCEIQKELNCSKGTISYYLGDGQKKKNIDRQNEYRRKNINIILMVKLDCFKRMKIRDVKQIDKKQRTINKAIIEKLTRYKNRKEDYYMTDFSTKDVLNMIGENPKCYLTGKPIDLTNSRSYHFDHKIPTSKGGKNTLENLGICTKDANMSKTDMSLDEYIDLCRQVLINFGYTVTKENSQHDSNV